MYVYYSATKTFEQQHQSWRFNVEQSLLLKRLLSQKEYLDMVGISK